MKVFCEARRADGLLSGDRYCGVKNCSRQFFAAVAACLSLVAVPAVAEIYTWKDADGRTHFSSTPPDARPDKATTVVVEDQSSGLDGGRRSTGSRERDADGMAGGSAESVCRMALGNMQAALPELRRMADDKVRAEPGKRGEYEKAMRAFNQTQAAIRDGSAQRECVASYNKPNERKMTNCMSKAKSGLAVGLCSAGIDL